MTMKLRLFTSWAADKMEETLLLKDKKGYEAWETQSHAKRYNQLLQEWEEVKDAVGQCCIEEKQTDENIKHLQLELTDLAIAAMMMAGGFDESIQKLRRGRKQHKFKYERRGEINGKRKRIQKHQKHNNNSK